MIGKAVEDFDLTIVEGEQFLRELPPISPSPFLQELLQDTVHWAIAVSPEKARSDLFLTNLKS